MKRKAVDSNEPEPTGGGTTSVPAEKKRKTGGGAIRIATRRTTRSQKPSLSIEMIAKVASFANYGDDLMNICVAVGPTDANIVTYVCLRNNVDYIRRQLARRTRNIQANTVPIVEFFAILDWMDVNPDWSKYCSKERVENPRYCNPTAETCDRSSHHLILFNNPAVAIEFGMVEILSYLVESVGIDINALKWTGWAGVVHGTEAAVPVHLLGTACTYQAFECVRYILSREDFDASSPLQQEDFVGCWVPMFNFGTLSAFRSLIEHHSFDVNGTAAPPGISNPLGYRMPFLWAAASLVIDERILDLVTSIDAATEEEKLAKFKCMLDAGADPRLGTLEVARTLLTQSQGGQRRILQILVGMMEDVISERNVSVGN